MFNPDIPDDYEHPDVPDMPTIAEKINPFTKYIQKYKDNEQT